MQSTASGVWLPPPHPAVVACWQQVAPAGRLGEPEQLCEGQVSANSFQVPDFVCSGHHL